MSKTLDLASRAYSQNEVPVGAIIVSKDNQVLAEAYNTKEFDSNACHHAEILAIQQASQRIGDWRLSGCSLYVSLEPCPMCMGALLQSRVSTVFFGAYDKKGGAISLGFNLHQNSKLNHKISIYGGFKNRECSKLLSDFFKAKRKSYK